MAKQNYSGSLFWARQIGLAVILIIVASIVIFLYEENASEPVPVGEPEEKSVSQGLSEFYREFRMSSTDLIKEELGDFVIELTDSDESLDEQLSGMSSELRPVNEGWQGEHKYRTFRAGNTLREAISGYAQQEGMQVIWDLDQDFVIKYQFQMDNTIVGSLSDIASAIDANFEGEVLAYICSRQRSLVITAEDSDYLKENCEEVE